MKTNYHTHTARCRHAGGTDRQFIESAIKSGYKVLGFADHVPAPVDNEGVQDLRMRVDEAAEYVQTLSALREEYKNDIKIHIGFECEYFEFVFDEHMKLLADAGCEYLILSQHYVVHNPFDPEKRSFTDSPINEDPDNLVLYIDHLIAGMNTGKFSCVGHPDLIKFNGDPELFTEHFTRFCKEAKRLNIPLEFNQGAYLDQGKHHPSEEFLAIVKAVGNEMIIGCDAHHPDRLERIEGYEKSRAHVLELGIPLIDELKLIPLK